MIGGRWLAAAVVAACGGTAPPAGPPPVAGAPSEAGEVEDEQVRAPFPACVVGSYRLSFGVVEVPDGCWTPRWIEPTVEFSLAPDATSTAVKEAIETRAYTVSPIEARPCAFTLSSPITSNYVTFEIESTELGVIEAKGSYEDSWAGCAYELWVTAAKDVELR